MSCSEIINTWINEWTVYYNTVPNPERIKHYMSLETRNIVGEDKFEEFLDHVTNCSYIIYKEVPRIILKKKDSKLDFIFSKDGCDNYCPDLRSLIGALLDTTLESQYPSILSISLSKARQVINDLKLNFDLNEMMDDEYYSIKGDRYYFDSDEQGIAEEYYEDWELYEEIKNKLNNILRYHIAPYRKYNPRFDFKNYLENNKYTYEDLFNILTTDQIIKILTSHYLTDVSWSWAEKGGISKEKIESLSKQDITTIRYFIEGVFGDDLTCKLIKHGASRLYGIIVE